MLRIFRDDSSALRAFWDDGCVVRTFKEYVMPYLSPNKTSRAYAPNTSSWPRAPSVVPASCPIRRPGLVPGSYQQSV